MSLQQIHQSSIIFFVTELGFNEQLSRNFFAKDYLKDHDVTREEFKCVWEALADDIREVRFSN